MAAAAEEVVPKKAEAEEAPPAVAVTEKSNEQHDPAVPPPLDDSKALASKSFLQFALSLKLQLFYSRRCCGQVIIPAFVSIFLLKKMLKIEFWLLGIHHFLL